MKKSFIFGIALSVAALTASYAQTTTNSTAKNQAASSGKEESTTTGQQHQAGAHQSANPGTPATGGQPALNKPTGSTQSNPSTQSGAGAAQSGAGATQSGGGAAQAGGGAAQTGSTPTAATGQQAQKTSPNDESNRPGAAEHKNANDVGRYSGDANSKSMLNSKEAVEQRNKNLTESDTTIKSGSGSSSKNMKDHTGKTGNYENQQIKHDQKTSPRP